jgi:hypothetical protein
VFCNAQIFGYSRFGLIRASSVANRQSQFPPCLVEGDYYYTFQFTDNKVWGDNSVCDAVTVSFYTFSNKLDDDTKEALENKYGSAEIWCDDNNNIYYRYSYYADIDILFCPNPDDSSKLAPWVVAKKSYVKSLVEEVDFERLNNSKNILDRNEWRAAKKYTDCIGTSVDGVSEVFPDLKYDVVENLYNGSGVDFGFDEDGKCSKIILSAEMIFENFSNDVITITELSECWNVAFAWYTYEWSSLVFVFEDIIVRVFTDDNWNITKNSDVIIALDRR